MLFRSEAAVGETPLPLTRSEYAICEYLALHAGQTFTKEQIYEAVFGIDGTADDTAVTQHIKNIRAKLRAAVSFAWSVKEKNRKYVQTKLAYRNCKNLLEIREENLFVHTN